MREGEVAGAPSRGAYPTTHSCACLSAHRTYGLCGLAQVSARTALRARFAVSRSAAARRVPLDLRTHSVRQIRRDTSASWTRVAAQLKPMKRHCFAHRAKQAEPPPTHNRSVRRYAVRRRGPRSDRALETGDDTSCNRSVWRYAVHRRGPRPDRAVETCGGTSCTEACDAATMRRGELRGARWRGGGVATRAGSPSYARWGRCEA